MIKQTALILGLLYFQLVLWVGLMSSRDRPFVAAAVALLASPLLLLILRRWFEGGHPTGLLHPRTQSWAFLFGVIAIAVAFGIAAYGHQSVPADSRFHTTWYWLVCVLIGMVAGATFHYGMELKAYAEARHGAALASPTKLAHDFVSYPLLLGGLLYVWIPVLVYQFRWTGASVLACVVVWAAMIIRDALHPPEPANLHPKWDPRKFSVQE